MSIKTAVRCAWTLGALLLAVPAAAQSPRFTVEKLVSRDSHSTLTIGPDGHLYATVTTGDIWRYRLDSSTGKILGEERILKAIASGTVAINGFAFHPSATATDLRCYVTAVNFSAGTGQVYRCRFRPAGQSNPLLEKTLFISKIGLMGNHAVNNMRFGNDGFLYVNLAGQHHSGFEPVPHSAAIVQVALGHSAFNNLPVDINQINVQNGGAAIRLFATGLRNPHGLHLHSNGDFYATTHDPFNADEIPDPRNGTGKIQQDLSGIPDFLVRVKKGKYYGHPNPKRGEFTSYGGNPTSGKDPYEMDQFPVGTQPEPNYDLSLIQGVANHMCITGLDEYTNGSLLVSYLKVEGASTGRVEWFHLNSSGGFTGRGGYIRDAQNNVIVFNGVLDVAVTSRGWVYVADFGTRAGNLGQSGSGDIFLLKPVSTNVPPTVSITQPANQAQLQAGQNVTIRADASDSDGSVSEVTFIINGQDQSPKDTTSGNGFTFAWNNVQAGTYTLAARARDDDGATQTSSTITVVVDPSQTAPTISSVPVTTAFVGTAYLYDVNAAGTPAPAYALDGAPAGMTIDAQTGRIDWVPSGAGAFAVDVRAMNGVNPVATQSFVVTVSSLRSPEYPPGTGGELTSGIEFSYYESIGGLSALPDFGSLTATKAGTAPTVTLSPADRSDNYALLLHGFVEVPQDGSYTFSTASDDGSQLLIGNQLVVENDGLHGVRTRSGSIGLSAGRHALKILYFQAGGGQALTVSYDGPGISGPIPIPGSTLYHFASPYGLDHRTPVNAYLNMPATENGILPTLLSQTGAFSDTALFILSPGAIPYDVNSPLWSDGASKARWFFVPSGRTITFVAQGEWAFPEGAVLVKHFALGASKKRVETRINVVKADGSIYGVTYRWRPDESDADLVTAAVTAPVSFDRTQQDWYFPSPADCLKCHTPPSGFILGLKTRQLNGVLDYASTGKTDNQLRTLNRLGLFSPSLDETAIPGFDRLVPLNDAGAALEERVRSYLDSNCAHCHRPGAVNSNWDGRYDTPLASQGLIDAMTLNNLGIPDARIVYSGSPSKSTLYLRMDSLTLGTSMPPLAKSMRDQAALQVFSSWIQSLPPSPAPVPPGAPPSGGGTGGSLGLGGSEGRGACGALGIEFLVGLAILGCARRRF